MSAVTPLRRKRHAQQGYALLLAVLMMALVVISLAVVRPDVLINGRRQKEEEMIWRGKQYVRGIRLYVRYYQMHGGATRFPTSLEDLTKNKVGIRFMRQAYKDPVNSADGSWRLIYVGPNGQLIGSLKQRSLGTNTPGTGGFGSLFGNPAQSSAASGSPGGSSFGNSSFGNSSFGNSSFGNSSFGNSSFGNSSFGNSASSPGANTPGIGPGSGPNPQQGTDAGTDQMSTPQPIANSDTPTEIIGGNIIGVGSKVNQRSIIWYDKAKNYRQFEFIWDPSKEPVNGGANAGVIGIPQQPANSLFGGQGSSGFGQQPGGTTTNPGAPGPGSGQQLPPGQTSPTPQ